MKIADYLEMAKMITGSDYETAKRMDVTKQAISNWRRGTSHPDSYACSRLAEILEIPELKVIATNGIETEKSEERREYWKKKLIDLGGIAASLLLGVNIIVTPHPAEAAPLAQASGSHCILCQIVNIPAAPDLSQG